ncbi:translocon-associated protein subunit gamma [Hyalella azteca]|uniref:Translocon-associated protein subunit gamma n=1 Tax=Hyalella azteca TaxID=294128 RepID=A0A8B7NZQ4_HYAAZ|nr:translocon-associated protein subunit gamma [Hyalella azteca]
MVKSSKFTKEEELLLEDFSRNISKKTSLMFYLNAFIASTIPIWLYIRIHMMELISSSPLFVIMTAASTYLLAFAYKNSKFVLKHKVAQKVEESVTKAVLKQLGDKKKTVKSEKDERVLWKKNEVADSEATTFALFYNNAMFLMLVVLGSFLVFRTLSPSYNYFFSIIGAAGVTALFSTSTSK